MAQNKSTLINLRRVLYAKLCTSLPVAFYIHDGWILRVIAGRLVSPKWMTCNLPLALLGNKCWVEDSVGGCREGAVPLAGVPTAAR
jgi:hypothetical protein